MPDTQRHCWWLSLASAIWLLSGLLSPGLGASAEKKALRMITVRERSEAEGIHKQLQRGASFSALAAAKSIGIERRAWGYSGVISLEEVQPVLRPVLRALKEGQFSKVLELEQRFVIIKVISPQIARHFDTADTALANGQIEQAQQALQTALGLEKDNVEAYIKLGLVADAAKQYDKALEYLDKAQRYAPDAAQIAILQGAVSTRAAIAHQQPAYAQQALQAYHRALQLEPRLAPSVHFGLGKVYLVALRQPAEALPHLQKAIEPSPRVPEVYRLLIQAYYDTHQYQQAWQHLRLAQGLGYDFPDLVDALRRVQQESKQ